MEYSRFVGRVGWSRVGRLQNSWFFCECVRSLNEKSGASVNTKSETEERR